MPIITISMDDDSLVLLDRMKRDLGLRGRSDTVRTALRSLSLEHEKLEMGEGLVEGVLIVMHREAVSAEIDSIRHTHHDVIKTQLHNHLHGGKCLQTLIVSGDAAEIHDLIHSLKRPREIEYIRFVPSNRG